MLVASPEADLKAYDANTKIYFRSAVPAGLAVIPIGASGEKVAAVAEPVMSEYHVPMLGIPNFKKGDDTKLKINFSGAMEGLGYRVRGECLDAEVPGTPGRFYFSKDTGGARTHQVHVCAVGHPEITDKLAFRDYLRVHPHRAAEYGALKERLAHNHRHDIVGYMRGKDAFIRSMLDEARNWSQSVSLTDESR